MSKYQKINFANKMEEESKIVFLNNIVQSCEILEHLKPSDTLYIINPFQKKHDKQSTVEIQAFVITRVDCDRNNLSNEKNVFYYHGYDKYKQKFTECRDFFGDYLVTGCKFITTDKKEAESELREVHAGKYARFVKAYHDSCNFG